MPSRRPVRLAALALALAAVGAGAAVPTPRRHRGFDHYTFALTWQPGFCATHPCAKDQPQVAIGLHGLWASRPPSLVRAKVPPPKWWAAGCDRFHPSDRPPPISPSLRRRLLEFMPRLPSSLLTHEYDKHVQCFGFDAPAFFRTELRMRRAVAKSAFGRRLVHLAGHQVSRHRIVEAFEGAFHTPHADALQLRCRKQGPRALLTQLWLTIPAERLGAFPRPEALMDAREHQDDCPARFWIPTWKR